MRKPTMWLLNRSDTKWTVQSQKMARSLKFWIRKERNCIICVAKTKALISFAVTVKLICAFVFAYAKCCFPLDAALIFLSKDARLSNSISIFHKSSCTKGTKHLFKIVGEMCICFFSYTAPEWVLHDTNIVQR